MRRTRIILLSLIVILKMAASLAKCSVDLPDKIYIQMKKASEINLLIALQFTVTLLLSRKTRSRGTII